MLSLIKKLIKQTDNCNHDNSLINVILRYYVLALIGSFPLYLIKQLEIKKNTS